MPPWGRPPGGGGGGRGGRVSELQRQLEDVYRFQELDSEDERPHGVLLDPLMQKNSHFNPDELYFNDMDLRAWQRKTSQEQDDLAYGDDYGHYQDEDDYYPGGADSTDQDDYLAHRVMEKIQRAKVTGGQSVNLTPDELAAYEYSILRQQAAPAARQPAKAKASSTAINSANSSSKSRKSQQRASIFAPRASPKSSKPSSRKRATSNASEALPPAPPPGFIIPGPNGQSTYAPITYSARNPRDPTGRKTSSPSRPGSRSASMSSRQTATPPRDFPGAFPNNSPQRYRETTPPLRQRPVSSSSRHSTPDDGDWQQSARSRSSSIQQPAPNLVPFPVQPYQHYTADPYAYHVPSQSSSSQPSLPLPGQPQPQGRRVVSGPASDPAYVTIPRRVPVPVQRAGPTPAGGMQGSYSDPALGYRNSGLRDELSSEEDSEDEDDEAGVVIDVVPEPDAGYRVHKSKAADSGHRSGSGSGSGSGARSSPSGGHHHERRRRTRRK